VTRVVAIGGGHGLAATLRAVLPWAAHVTAVVSTADDGGSTGRLRAEHPVPGLGDLRRCLTTLADAATPWAQALERRFEVGDLAGHPTGNLVLLSLLEVLGDLQGACDELARTAHVDLDHARVVPVTGQPVALCARTLDGARVEGQVAVADTPGIDEVWVEPAAEASPLALEAIGHADLVVMGPGSLYTSVLAAAVVGDLRKALAGRSATLAYVGNLRPDHRETIGYDQAAHVAALHRHDVQPDVVLCPAGALAPGQLDLPACEVDLAAADGVAHDPVKLGGALRALL
jgi:uncharacterized cofD-like protein